MRRFGEKLRALRLSHGMTTRDLAVALGYSAHSQGMISEIETGKRRPKIDFLLKITAMFGVTLDQLARDDMELPPLEDY